MSGKTSQHKLRDLLSRVAFASDSFSPEDALTEKILFNHFSKRLDTAAARNHLVESFINRETDAAAAKTHIAALATILADTSNAEAPPISEDAMGLGGDTAPAGMGDNAWLGAAEIARQFPQLDPSAVESQLRRYRAKNRSCYREMTDPKPREPRFLYHFGSVKHLF